MPRMTRWDVSEPIDVPSSKAAVYAAQGWVAVGAKPAKVQPAMVRATAAIDEPPVVEPAPKPAKKVPAKKTAKK